MKTCAVDGCLDRYRAMGLCRRHYKQKNRPRWSDGDPERRKARQRARTHHRKAVGRYGDVTPEFERQLRGKARLCPLCGTRMLDAPYLPESKELDHMVPLGIGGTHTIGNVRIICRACNIARPKDGSDYVGPITLWAMEPGFMPRAPRRRGPQRTNCACGAEKRRGRCLTCQPLQVRARKPKAAYRPARDLTPTERHERALRAARMREQGESWWSIADALGFGRESSAFLAVQRVTERNIVTLSSAG